MILDLLPYNPSVRQKNILPKAGRIRYLVFILSFIFVGVLFLSGINNLEKVIFWSFVAGNLLYYAIGIFLAYYFKDNRAFCKYFCPVTVFLKPSSYFSLMRINYDEEKCISCKKCIKICPTQALYVIKPQNKTGKKPK